MSMFEPLENRRHLAAHITEITADNRGEVVIQLSEAVKGVSRTSVRLYTFGPDGIGNNSDDVFLKSAVNYDAARQRITARVVGNLEANVGYRIRITAKLVRAVADNSQFDGEYKSDGTSGNGVGNGNYNARFRTYRSNETPRARLSTTAGIIDIALRRDVAPLNVANFLRYADAGRYDNLFVNRSIAGFIVQLGAARVTGDAKDATDVAVTEKFGSVNNEFNLSNVRGTLAFAKIGGQPNSATSDFFFNLGNNSGNLDTQNSGFTVFATVVNSSGLSNMDAIAAKQTVALQNENTASPTGILQGQLPGTGLTDVPVNSLTGLSGVSADVDGSGQPKNLVQSGLVPSRDLVIVRRTALLLKTASV